MERCETRRTEEGITIKKQILFKEGKNMLEKPI
jgi:hypothetical protein